MKKIILILMVMAATLYADTTKVIYITRTDTTLGTRYANVDSIRNAIESDQMGQLPGVWKVDLLNRTEAETKLSSFWANYDVIMTWGAEEGGSGTYSASIDQILDTIHKPVICRDAYVAKADPMWLGTTRITALNSTNAPSHYRVDNTTHFITRTTYTDNGNFGDSVALYALTTSPNTDGLTGMSGNVTTLIRMARDLNNGDNDSAHLVVLDSGGTNTNSAATPHRRAFISLNSSWQYCSWASKELFFRTLRWAIADTVVDTAVTMIRIAREGIDGSWLEYSGISCQETYHYGGIGSIRMGFEVADRVPLLRIRSTAISRQLPDTTDDWSYDITDVNLVGTISLISDATPSFSWWQGLFGLESDTLWQDAKVSIQLDSTCSSWNGALNHAYSNNLYLQFPDQLWHSERASTRGTDYSATAFDSIWLQNPIVDNTCLWDIPVASFEAMMDSATNKGMVIHTIGTTTGTAEIDMWNEQRQDASVALRNSMRADVTIAWRAANSAPPDADSTIAFNPDSLEFSGYVDGVNPSIRTLAYYNGSSSEYFSCDAVVERPTASWLTQVTQGDGYITNSVDLSGLTAGYYSTYLVLTCTGVSDSPDSAKVVLWVYPVPSRPTGGKLKF